MDEHQDEEERRVLGEDMIAKRLMAGIANGQT